MSVNEQQNGHGSAPDALTGASVPSSPNATLLTGKRRAPWGLVVVAILFVVAPFLAWYGTTFWRTLTDAQIDAYLSDTREQRHVQHALSEIDRRIERGDAGARRWYPRVVEVSTDQATDLRLAAAWVMGDDNREGSFHDALVKLLGDQEPSVRRMAALSLSRFDDPRSRAELAAMLQDYSVRAGVGGKILTVLPVGSVVTRQAMIARVRDDAGEVREVRSPLAGGVEKVSARENSDVKAGDELLVLAPDGANVLQSLRALYLVGTIDDLPEVERYAGGVAGMPAVVQQQATLTAEAIRRRNVKNP
jgi:hypothetical protein